MRTVKGFVLGVIVAVIFTTGLAVAAVKNEGNGTLTCQAATLTFTSFANAPGNTVTIKAYRNGVVFLTTTHVFNGPSSTATVPLGLAGSGTIEVRGTWNTNGHVGNMTTGVGPFACETKTVTVTTPAPPAQTTTVTQTTPAPPAQTVTTTTTLPAPPAKVIIKKVNRPRPPCAKGDRRMPNGSCRHTVIKKESPKCKPKKPDNPRCEGDCSRKKLHEGGSG